MYYAKQGEFTSPGYPAEYAHNLNCDYRIMAKPTDFVTLNFQEPFEMEQSKFLGNALIILSFCYRLVAFFVIWA